MAKSHGGLANSRTSDFLQKSTNTKAPDKSEALVLVSQTFQNWNAIYTDLLKLDEILVDKDICEEHKNESL